MIPLFLVFSDYSLLLLRLIFGLILVVRGWPKIKNFKTNIKNFPALIEFLGGIMITLGLASQVAALLIAIEMAAAIVWKIREGQKLRGGFELELILFAVALALATLGAGIYSLDSFWQIRIY